MLCRLELARSADACRSTCVKAQVHQFCMQTSGKCFSKRAPCSILRLPWRSSAAPATFPGWCSKPEDLGSVSGLARRIVLLCSVELLKPQCKGHELSHGLAACDSGMATTMLVNAMSRLNMRPCRALQASPPHVLAAYDALAPHAGQAAEHCAEDSLTTLHCVQSSRRSPASSWAASLRMLSCLLHFCRHSGSALESTVSAQRPS